jgi:hypothetical protein
MILRPYTSVSLCCLILVPKFTLKGLKETWFLTWFPENAFEAVILV